MSSDSAIPNLESNAALPDADVDLDINDQKSNSVHEEESNSIIPDTELNSVLNFLKSNSDSLKEQSAATDVELAATSQDFNTISLLSDIDAESGLLTVDASDSAAKNNVQVQLKHQDGRILIVLPTELQLPASEFAWSEIWQQLQFRLMAGDRLRVPNTPVHLIAHDRLLDVRQLQELAESLNQMQLHLQSVASSRRQTAIAAVTCGYSVEQLQPATTLSSEPKGTPTAQADALYLEMTVRSGVEIRHPGTVILLGDINPGGIVVADGDILVWGRLRGVAHAGAAGNRECLIMALQMEPTQLRIADAVARSPETLPTQFLPEVAHITPQGIRIVRTTEMSRNFLSRINQAP
ncbi:septum site-determining protein MinC [Anabaena sp. 4-3]|uniref:septum site-determining protein MinC n=1 Tax=Anabaena sp. 4-3 TaxID=1811979 RepID=UPI0008302EAC|nr:septum site-determining protein MinC [Anabaena sp. 4-3]